MKKSICIFVLLGTLVACNPPADDPAASDKTFTINLLSPENETMLESNAVTLSWSGNKDSLTYTVYLDESSDPSTALVEKSSDTTYEVASLAYDKTYYWKVEGTDTKGEKSTSEIRSFTVPNASNTSVSTQWVKATENAGWSARRNHTSVVFDNKIWVVGGEDEDGLKNDVWYSEDGINWVQAIKSAPWSPRSGHTSVVYDKKIWVMGGAEKKSSTFLEPFLDDIWYSKDGIKWFKATDSPGWSFRTGHSSIVFDNKMWVMGGSDGISKKDIWCSNDGIKWTRLRDNLRGGNDNAWVSRLYHTSVVYDGKMWIIGGYHSYGFSSRNLDDFWYSGDGTKWIQGSANAIWKNRSGHTSIVFDGKMWIIGGTLGASTGIGDVWYSSDGLNWEQQVGGIGNPRFYHSSVVFNDRIWIIGGIEKSSSGIFGNRIQNDIWYYSLK